MSEEIIKALKIISKETGKDSIIAILRNIKKDTNLREIKKQINEKIKHKMTQEYQFYDNENPIDEDLEEEMALSDLTLLEGQKIYILKKENTTESTNINENTNNISNQAEVSNISFNNKDKKDISKKEENFPQNDESLNNQIDKNEINLKEINDIQSSSNKQKENSDSTNENKESQEQFPIDKEKKKKENEDESINKLVISAEEKKEEIPSTIDNSILQNEINKKEDETVNINENPNKHEKDNTSNFQIIKNNKEGTMQQNALTNIKKEEIENEKTSESQENTIINEKEDQEDLEEPKEEIDIQNPDDSASNQINQLEKKISKKSGKKKRRKNNVIKQTKTLFFFVIIQSDCLNKIKLKTKNSIPINEPQKQMISYEDFTTSSFYILSKTIKRSILFYEIKIPIGLNSIQIYLEYDTKKYENNKAFDLGDKTNLIAIELSPFYNYDLKKNYIIFEESQQEKKKDALLNILITYFLTKDINWKHKFLEKYIENTKFEEHDFKKIFLIANLFNNKFLENDFYIAFKLFKNLKINKFGINNLIKEQIYFLYKFVEDSQNKEIIYEDIWALLILSLFKIQDKEKAKNIFSIIETLKKKNEIINVLFLNIKNFIGIIPEIKSFFVYLLKFKPNELNFMMKYINNYQDYIDIIENNINYLFNSIVIFPQKIYEKNAIKNSDKIIHQIINIIKHKKNNIFLDTIIFRVEFNNYLKILNLNEKKILEDYLKVYRPNDNIIKEIKIDNIKNIKDNEELIITLKEYAVGFEILEECIHNLNFDTLSEEQIKDLKIIISKICVNKKHTTKIYLILFETIKKLEDFYKLWIIFSYYTFQDNKERQIQNHIKKFWDLYSKEQNKDIHILRSSFFHMFFFLKENNLNNTPLEFLIKINEIKNDNLLILIYENICKYRENLIDEEKRIIYNFLISLSNDKFISLIDKNNIIQFICQNIENKQIETDYFYKENEEINSIFKIFGLISKVVESKKNEFQKNNFYEFSINNFNKFIQSIYDNEINFEQLEILSNHIKNNIFYKKLLYFNYTEREKNELYKNIQNNYLFFKENKDKLKECLKYLEDFPSAEDSKQKKIINSKIRYSEKTLKKFEKNLKEKNFCDYLEKLYERAKKYNKMIQLKTSKIFMGEIENRVDKEEGKIRYFESKINDMRKILSIRTINEIDKAIYLDFLSLFQNEDELILEIKNLKAYFKFSDDTSIIEKYLIFNLKKIKLFQTLESMIEIIHQFNLNKTDFFEKLIKLKENLSKLEDNISEKTNMEFDEELLEENTLKINEFISEFESFEPNLKFKLFPMDIISFVVNKFQENKLLIFLFDLTINDLRDITDSLAGSSLNINDINDYQIIKNIINILKEKSGFKEEEYHENKNEETNENKHLLKDIQFLELIPNIIEQKLDEKTMEDFKIILENCSKNQPKLLILFDNKKGFESNKEDIRNIINESIFEIYLDKEKSNILEFQYNCRCLYKERTDLKTMKELIVLQQLASLSQNKEKNDENKILNIFIDIIENIKDILSLIDKISNKGFPQEFYYLIDVIKGEANCKDMNIKTNKTKKLYEEKANLTKLLKNINKSQIEAYREHEFIKFFYGKQIKMFNDYLKNKIGISTNKNQVSNLIHYLIGNKYNEEPNFLYKTTITSSFIEYNPNEDNKEYYEYINPYQNKDSLENNPELNDEEINLNQINFKNDSLKEISNSNLNISSKKNNKTKNQLKRTITSPLLKEGTQKELESIMKEMYENVENYLIEVMYFNKIEEKDIFENSIIKNEKYIKNNKKGFFIINSIKNIYKQILNFYHGLVGNDPPRYSLLLCNEETMLEEILSFIYLSVFCPYYSLFIIAKPDRLNIDIIYEVVNIIEKFIDEKIDIKSYILFLFNDIGKSEIGNELLKICQSAEEPKEDLREFKTENEISTSKFENKDFYKNIEIVESIQAGFGKTFYIKKNCRENGLEYKPFQIGGEVKRQTIMRRLEELNIEEGINYGLHLDFSDTKQKELFEDFIFSFLIQKFYSNNEKIYCYEDNVKIFIEIPNGFFNFMDKFELFSEFPIHKIIELPEYELSETDKSFHDFEDIKEDLEKNIISFLDIQKKNKSLNHNYLYKSDIQLVCNYLKFLDRMSSQNLYFYNLNEKLKELSQYNYYCDSEIINENECRELLNKFFNKKNRSYHQINIYIKVLADQLRKFSINFYLNIENLKDNLLPGTIRTDIIKAFMDLTSYFTIGAFDKILSEQDFSTNERFSDRFNENEEIIKAAEKLSKEESVINFSELNDKALIFINNDGQSFTIVTCAPKNSEIYQKLESLFNSGAKFEEDQGKHFDIPDYNSMKSNKEFLEIIKNIVNSQKPIKEMIQKLGSYVFNADNFFKMVQILIRIRTGVPVLIMGETGCGKTSLINAIAEINNYKMITLNIHAGITDNEIVQFMVINNLLETNLRYDKFDDDIGNLYNNYYNENDNVSISVSNSNISLIETIKKKNIENKNTENKNESIEQNEQLIIVFFDEFNTCNSLGLLTEIMCSKKCQGVEVKKNIAFVGACNPYRKIIKKKSYANALIKAGAINSNQNLVYTVNPLTKTQLYYIFNFGSLSEKNEKKYITGIVEAEIDEYINDKNDLNNIKEIMIKAFIAAQSFIREKNGKESVSMRETRKFMIIYKFLIKDFQRKHELSNLYNNQSVKDNFDDTEYNYKFYFDIDEYFAQRYSIATSIYICFYIRLSDEKDKNEFRKKMKEIIKVEFILYPNQLQDELIENIKLEKGIAANESLKLNLFVCFIGILTRIAVFLVGPPGCSKTLCFKILKEEMKGYHSKSKFWQQYPQLVVTSYQGSLTSTSKGIIKAFNSAKDKLKSFLEKNKNTNENQKVFKKQNKGIISCVFIDEIGLCEISPSNPLKALHTQLELDYKNQNIEEKLAFIGISNWILDAAKMNRGIYLNVLNPTSNIHQMKETALKITNIYDKYFSIKYKELIEKLTESIFKYNLYLEDVGAEQINFHGTRDFYYLIKTLTKRILDKNNNEETGVTQALSSIESNYNGISRNGQNSSDWIKKEFKKNYLTANDAEKSDFGIIECIKMNLNDNDSRYLLLIMKSNLSQYLVLRILKGEKDENKIIYYLGSLFEEDIESEAYSAKAINKIKYYLELDICLILKNLSTTYASLYDLLNQRFTYIKNKKYAEISLGEVSNSTFVNNDLKIIVLIREEAVKMQDPPFLNRFEKYYISFDNILDSESKKIAAKFLEYRKLFKKLNRIKYNFENEIINFYDEEIKSIISDYNIQNEDKNKTNEENITNYILEKISKTFPQELIAFSNHYKKNTNFVNKVNTYYSHSIHSNFETYIGKTSNSKNAIYTFTSVTSSLKLKFEVNNMDFGVIKDENIEHIHVKLLRSEHQFEININDFYEGEKKLLIIHFEETDSQNLEFILMFLERFEKELKELKKKIIVVLIHLSRGKEEFNKDIFVPNLSDFEQTFIDNLFGRNILISEIMGQSIKELYNNKKLIDIDELFKNELFICFQKIDYLFQDKEVNQNDYINDIIRKILDDENLMNRIKKRIIEEIEKIQNFQEDYDNEEIKNIKEKGNIFDNIFENNTFESRIDFISMLVYELEQKFTNYLTKFIVNSEKLSILSSLSKNLPESGKSIWVKLLDEFNFCEEINNNLKSNKIKVWTKLNLPSKESIKKIEKIIKSDSNGYFKSYLEQETRIRECSLPSDIIENDDENEDIDEEKINLINEFFIDENNIEDERFENVKENIKKFFVPKAQAINFIKNQIEKDEFIQTFGQNNKEELLSLFFKDYYSNLLTSILQSEENLYYDILKYLIELRFGEKPEKDSLEYYSKSILWIQIYKDEFIYILRIFGILNEIFPNIDYLSLVKEKIKTKEIDYIISSHHPRHKKLIDKPFLLILDSIFFNLIELVEKLESNKVVEIINKLSEIVQNGEICNTNIKLKSKDFYRFKTLFFSIKLFNDNIYDKEKINLYISLIKKERQMLKDNKMEEVSEEIKNQLNLLLKILPDCEEKTKTIMKILISKYKEVTDLKCREIICGIVLSDNHLIKISNEFFIHILDLFSFTPSSLDPDNEESDNPFSKLSGQNILLQKINGNISKILLENLKYIFKFKILQYYNEELNKSFENDEKKFKEEINLFLGEEALNYFKNAHNTLIEIKKSKEVDIPNKNIKEIFCIVYCNIFLENFVKYAVTQVTLVSQCRTEIINFLNDGNSEIKETFKLFILKELKTKYILERTKFLNINEWTKEYKLNDLYKDLSFQKPNNKEIQGILVNLFYGGNNSEEFLNEKKKRKIIVNKYHELNESLFLCNIDLFINEYLSTLKTEQGKNLCQNSPLMKCFNDYINKNIKFSKSTKKLINLFFDYQEFEDKLSKTIDERDYLEIILYAYKISIICSMANPNSIYLKMIKENCQNEINKYYIPGADLYCDQWVESYNNMSDPISKFTGNGYCPGFYICDCGEYYYQIYCGVPLDLNYCANCNKQIGGLQEKLVIRKEDNGKYKITRIYPNKKNKEDVESRQDLKNIYGEDFKNGYPSKIYEDFQNEILERMKADYKGIFEPSYLFFIKETKSIRNLNQISFRLLNFIIYSNIYFSYKCGFINLEEIKANKFVPILEEAYNGHYEEDDGFSYINYRSNLLKKRNLGIKNEYDILEILKLNWDLLQKQLQDKKNQIFINLLFNELFFLIKNAEDMKDPEERNEFELKINALISKTSDNYDTNSKEYLDFIKNLVSENLEAKYVILEDDNMIDNVDFQFPYYYELLSIPTVEENILKEKLDLIDNVESKYPVLCSYLNANKKDIEYLQTFSQINNFVNYTIEKYTNEISRVKAQSIKINNEINEKNIPKNLFNEFLKGFNKSGLYQIATRYECHDLSKRIKIRELTKEDRLSDFLIDDGVQDYGMQLAAVYQIYYSYQNSFLNKVIEKINKKDVKLEYLKSKIEEKINPQKANKVNIVSFEIATENYESFLEMLLFYSYKDSFNENFEYDFSKKDRIEYNLEEIEEQLENLILPGKRLFNTKLDFVVYQFEGFRSQNSSVLAEFTLNFPQIELNEDQKDILYKFNKDSEQYSIESKLKILFSIQIMITYYIDRISMFNKDILVSETINDFPTYFKIPEDTKKLFTENKFKISHILSVYEYFELLCFNEFKSNILPIYKEEIKEEKKEKLFNYFKENPNCVLNKLQISTAIRRFISRSLVGKREDFEVDSEHELFSILQIKEDCWRREILGTISFKTEIEKLKELQIKVSEVLNLYDVLGGDIILLGEKVKKQVEKKEVEEIEEEKDKQNKKKKEKKKGGKKKQIF